MANPSKRHRPWTSRLFLEAFERRDLLSGTKFTLESLVSSISSSELVSLQSNDWTPHTLKSLDYPKAIQKEILQFFTLIENYLAGMNSLTQSTDSASAGQGTTDLTGGTTLTTDPAPATGAGQGTTDLTSGTTLTTDPAPATGSTVSLSGAVNTSDPLSVVTTPVSPQLKQPTAVATGNTVQDPQSQTASGSSAQGAVGQDDNYQAAIVDNSTPGSQGSNEAKTAVPVEVDSYLNDAANNAQRAGVYSLPSDNLEVASSLTNATPGTPLSLSPGVPTNSMAGGTMQPIGRVSVADAAARGSLRGTVADVRPTLVRDLNSSMVPDSSRSRTESDATLSNRSATVSTVLLSKPRSVDGLTELNHVGMPSDRLGYLNRALSGNDWDLPAPVSARRDAPLEMVATDAVFGQAARRELNNSGAGDQSDPDEVEPSPVDPPARGEGLLGSPLLFDLDSLAQEAQKFFAQIEQMGQDLAGLLGRTNLLSGLVAIGLAASALEVARRRKQRAAHGMVLQACAEPTFTSYPGLGGTWTWEEK